MNSQVNGIRESLNNKTKGFTILGQTKRIYWNSKRRYRTI